MLRASYFLARMLDARETIIFKMGFIWSLWTWLSQCLILRMPLLSQCLIFSVFISLNIMLVISWVRKHFYNTHHFKTCFFSSDKNIFSFIILYPFSIFSLRKTCLPFVKHSCNKWIIHESGYRISNETTLPLIMLSSDRGYLSSN